MQLELVFCPDNFRVWVCVCVLPVNFRVGGSLERGRVRPAHEEPWHPAAATPARRGEGRGEGVARAGPQPRRSRPQPHRPRRPRSPSPRPATTVPSKPRGRPRAAVDPFPGPSGLGQPPRPGGCSLLTGVWAGSGGGRRRCWPPPLPPLLGAWAAHRVSAAAMDEQAGPGVFFGNNHPGAGGAKGLGPLAEAAAAGDGAAAAGAARAQYSLPGILHFLQHEWARFEVERAQWEVERAELQVKTLPAWPSSSRLFVPPPRPGPFSYSLTPSLVPSPSLPPVPPELPLSSHHLCFWLTPLP